jgi:hypothetical protein
VKEDRRPTGRRWLRCGLALGTLGALTAAGVVAAQAWSGNGARPSAASPAPPSATVTEAADLYRDARLSLSPLLVHLPQEQQLFTELLGGKPVVAGTAEMVTGWANDDATARDLVGRLPAPAAIAPARDLYRLGAALYAESARTVAGAITAAAPAAEVRAARRLQLLGDAVFDAGHRLLLPRTETGALTVDRPAAAATPDFAAAGVAPPDGSSPALGGDRSTLLVDVTRMMTQTSGWLTGGPTVSGGNGPMAATLRSAASVLASDSDAALAVAALVDAEALRAPAPTDGARRLYLIAGELWAAGREIGGGPGSGPAAAPPALPSTGLDPGLLDAGGMFNGHPPALRPGDPPDKDVPGGFPSLNGVLTGGA